MKDSRAFGNPVTGIDTFPDYNPTSFRLKSGHPGDTKGVLVGNTQIFTIGNFKEEVLDSKIPVLVDFTATWCGPCQKLAPIIEDLATEYQGKVKVGKLDIDQNQELASRYGIMSVPTVVAFLNGEPKETMVGLNSKSYYKSQLDQMVGKSS